MIKGYKGRIITANTNLVATSNTSASGMWQLEEQFQAAATSSWPVPTPPALTPLITIPGTVNASGNQYAPTQAEYTTAGMSYPSTISYAFSSGYHYFTIPAGTFNVNIRGAEGSGTNHGYGANLIATLVATSSVRLIALVGSRGAGAYAGGGGSFLAIAPVTDTYSGSTALLVAGGGGGGYSSLGTYSDAGGTAWTSTSRRSNNTDCATYGGGVYDAGAGFSSSFHTVSIYSCTTGGAAAHFFDTNGTGGVTSSCGSNYGGFGGAGGGCPGGGGGYYGGTAGGNTPSQTGGGGGTSYRLTSGTAYISSWSDGSTWSSGNRSSTGSSCYNGFLSIVAA